MANSRFEYVKKFETDDRLLPDCWIVVRLDGKGFTKCANAPQHRLQCCMVDGMYRAIAM